MSKKSKKQIRWELINERQKLEENQKHLRENYELLLGAYASQLNAKEIAMKAEDDRSLKEIDIALDKITNLRKEIEDEYNSNLDRIDKISKIIKCDSDRVNSTFNIGIGALTGLGGLALSGLSLHKAYKSDNEGGMVFKKTLDVFNRINPMNLLKKK